MAYFTDNKTGVEIIISKYDQQQNIWQDITHDVAQTDRMEQLPPQSAWPGYHKVKDLDKILDWFIHYKYTQKEPDKIYIEMKILRSMADPQTDITHAIISMEEGTVKWLTNKNWYTNRVIDLLRDQGIHCKTYVYEYLER